MSTWLGAVPTNTKFEDRSTDVYDRKRRCAGYGITAERDPARYSIYSELVDLRRERENSVHLVLRNATLNADFLYF